MSFLAPPPRWSPTAPPEDTATAAQMLETAEHEQYTRHHDLTATQSPVRPDGRSTSGDSTHRRSITTATSAFSVTLPGQPALPGHCVTFADADDGVIRSQVCFERLLQLIAAQHAAQRQRSSSEQLDISILR